jgi:rRNA maturation RNase YbeY
VQLKITANPNFAECSDADAPWLVFLAGLAAEIGPAMPCVEVNFIDDKRMRELNREYRGKDASTDVLSYSYGASAAGEADPGEDPEGEILISIDRARLQADEADEMESVEEPFRRRIARHFRAHPERS